MPLAIELAATRMAVLSPSQLRERLGRSLALLGREGGGKHASMRRTILDSVELLSRAEARVFGACAVFRNGFSLQAAESVLGGVVVRQDDVLRMLESLTRRSLLRADFAPANDEASFAFFETVREVAGELLLADPAREELVQRHVAHYCAMATQLGREATVRSGGSAFVELARDLDNLVQAHAAALGPGGAGARVAIAIALGLDPLLSARGSSGLRLRLLDASIDGLAELPKPTELTEALLARGLAWRELGELTRARADFERGLSLATHHAQPGLAALALTRIGEIIDVAGATSEALTCFGRALDLLRDAPDDSLRKLREAEAFVRMGHAHRREGQLEAAGAAVGQAIVRYRLLGNDEGLAGALYEAAVIAMFLGESDAARGWFDEGLEVARRAGVRAIAGALTTARGSLLQELGSIDAALAHHAEAAQVFRELGSRYRETSALYYLATAYLERGDTREAQLVLLRARERVVGVGSPRYEALIDGGRACALATAGDYAGARAALEDAERAGAMCPSEPALAATLQIHRLSLALRTGEARDPVAAVAAARALATAHPSDDSRFALRLLLSAVGPTTPRPESTLVVWSEGRAFRLPLAARRVDLPSRSPVRRILMLLASRRMDAPGDVVPVEAIIEAGWQGERIRPEAALNRVYVALATLRKLGLREALVTAAGGYCLDPAIAVRFASREEEGRALA
jgi:tetratricopeptide (TPR) repeat protein